MISASEGAALHLEDLQHRLDRFERNTRGRFLAEEPFFRRPGTWKTRQFRRWFNSEVDKIFAQVDIVLAPATPCSAPPLGLQTMTWRQTMIARPALGLLTQPFSATGLSIVTVPVWRDDGLPIGVQVMAPPHKEELALRVAYDLERSEIAKSRIKNWS